MAAANSVRIASLLSLCLVICSGNRVGLSAMDGEANDGSISLNEDNNISDSAQAVGNSASSMGLGPGSGYDDFSCCKRVSCHKQLIGVGCGYGGGPGCGNLGSGCNTDCAMYIGCDPHVGYVHNADIVGGFGPRCNYLDHERVPATFTELTQKIKELTMKLDARGLGQTIPKNMDAMAPESVLCSAGLFFPTLPLQGLLSTIGATALQALDPNQCSAMKNYVHPGFPLINTHAKQLLMALKIPPLTTRMNITTNNQSGFQKSGEKEKNTSNNEKMNMKENRAKLD